MGINNVVRVEKDFLKVVDAALPQHQKVGRKQAQWLIDRVMEHGLTDLELEGMKGAFHAHRDAFDALADARLDTFLRKQAPKIVVEAPPEPAVVHGSSPDPSASDVSGASYGPSKGALIGVGGISATDPTQGEEGDCGLISSLSAIAAVAPKKLEKLFTPTGEGKWSVPFFIRKGNGFVKKSIEVDGDLPKKDGKPVYATSGEDGELWVSLLEKAFAKLRGGYDHLYAMYPETVMESLLGRHNRTIPLNTLDAEQAMKRLETWTKQKCAIVASSCPKGESHGKALKKIVADHAYALLRVYRQDGVPMVELRNPWGSYEPKKDGKDDGIFSLTIQEFLDNYLSIDVTPTQG